MTYDDDAELVLLGTGSRPAAELIDVVRGERLPWPAVVSEPFDHALSRDGWVAIQTNAVLHSVRDGDLGSLRRLPDVWTIEPAADPALLLARPRKGPGLVLLNAEGTVLRSATGMNQPCGEIAEGIVVCHTQLRSWDGDATPLPVAGRTAAVLDGRIIVTHDDDQTLRSHDTGDGSSEELRHPAVADLGFFAMPDYDRLAQRAAIVAKGTVFVAGPGTALRAFPAPADARHAVWVGDDRLLLVGGRKVQLLDLVDGDLIPVPLPRNAWPQLDVTGRLDPAQLRTDQQVLADAAAPDAASWQDELDRQAGALAEAAEAEGLGPEVAAAARPAIRLAPRVGSGPIGGTRLGGVPDVPAGWAWPRGSGGPLAFLAQLRLDDLHPGVIAVFAAIETDGWYPSEPSELHVEAFSDGEALAPAPVPDDLDPLLRFGPAAASAEPYLSPPNWDALEPTYGFDPVLAFVDRLERADPHHQVLGLSSSDQGHPPPEGKQLLLQLDSDSIMGVMWGDGGRLFVWGPPVLPARGVVDGCEIDMESM